MKIKLLSTNFFSDTKWLIVCILILAAVLRLWNHSNNPPSLTPDEASLGYNAYSILKTGKDEYGKILPVIFKSFGDYKPGLYIYAAAPFIAIFGLNEMATRMPSVIAGIFSVFFIYKIVYFFFPRDKRLPLIAAFFSTINPWLIFYSRGAWEANVSLTLTLSGIYFFLKSLEKPKLLIISSILFALTLWTYQGAKLSSSIVLFVLVITFRNEVRTLFASSKKAITMALLTGFAISLPVLTSFFNGQTGRLDVFSIFSYPRSKEYTQAFLDEGGEKFGGLTYYLFHSENLNFARGILGRWFNHFSGKYLFFEGDYQNPMHSAPNHGMLLLIDLLFIPIGFYRIAKDKSKFSNFALLWLILSPLPAILSRDQVQSVRALNMAIPLIIISSVGYYQIFSAAKTVKNSLFLHAGIFLFFTLSYIYFLDSYFVHFPVHNAKYWSYGYKDVVLKVTPMKDKYRKIIVQQSYNQPYIYFLFYQKYPPGKYQKQAVLKSGGLDVGFVENLDNISFENFSWPPPINDKNTLIIGNPVAIPPDFSRSEYNLITEIKYPDGFSTAFRIIDLK